MTIHAVKTPDERPARAVGRTIQRQRNAVGRALERVAKELEAFERPLTGTEAAAIVRAIAGRKET